MVKPVALMILATALLAACAGPAPTNSGDNGTVAPAQVVYRIDAQRYFEIVPTTGAACAPGRLFYIGTARGIRSKVARSDGIAKGKLIIDAANDQYLIGPIVLASMDCQTGDGSSFLCASRLPFSTDAGRTWKFNIPTSSGSDVYMAGSQVYTGGAKSSVPALIDGHVRGVWNESLLHDFPPPAKPPIDIGIHCRDKE